MSLQPSWYNEATKALGSSWDKRFELMGVETLRLSILNAGSAAVLVLPRPPQVKNPQSGLLIDANPPIEYAIDWLVRKVDEEKRDVIRAQKLATSMQRTALIVSILAAIATATTAASNVFLSVFSQ